MIDVHTLVGALEESISQSVNQSLFFSLFLSLSRAGGTISQTSRAIFLITKNYICGSTPLHPTPDCRHILDARTPSEHKFSLQTTPPLGASAPGGLSRIDLLMRRSRRKNKDVLYFLDGHKSGFGCSLHGSSTSSPSSPYFTTVVSVGANATYQLSRLHLTISGILHFDGVN